MNCKHSFCLASGSPRRKQILENMGYVFSVVRPVSEERPFPGEDPLSYVKRAALNKCMEGRQLSPLPVCLSADTIVILEGAILGKPEDSQDAQRILGEMSGREHKVATAVCLSSGQDISSVIVESVVKLRHLSSREIIDYCNTGEPLDKAGAYGIQGLGRSLVESYRGSFSNIVGLPEQETAELLSHLGIFPVSL